jgi:predicted  nucleic acid-binding Zn-ribbon protein
MMAKINAIADLLKKQNDEIERLRAELERMRAEIERMNNALHVFSIDPRVPSDLQVMARIRIDPRQG